VLLVLSLVLVAVMISVGAVLVLSLFVGSAPSVPDNATLYMDVEAPFSEFEPSDVLSQVISRPPTLRSTIDLLERAKSDSRVKTLVLRPATAGVLWAQLQELRAALVDFRSSGKRLTVFLESGGAGEFYLATAADRIVMMPAGQLDVMGLAFYELFFRGALDKLGIYPDLLHIGEYKTASNTFTEKSFTRAHREMTEALNRDWFEQLVAAVAEGRRHTPARAREALQGGPYTANGALSAGLVDELAYEDQLDNTEPIKGTVRLEAEKYAQSSAAPSGRSAGRIALLYAVGTIANGKSSFDSPTGHVVGSDTFSEWLRKVRVDPAVRAVVVRIDSPGGSAIASEVIWRELMLTRDVKPVVVSMGDVAASGGYYIAAPAHAIVAQPGTLTGSIGVLTGKFVIDGTLAKLGVEAEAVTAGPSADLYSPFRAFSPEERARVEQQMQVTYELFLRRVAEGRGESSERIDAAAQGRVWTGRQALELGLVDELGGLDDAIRVARERAKLDPAGDIDLVVYPPKRSLYEALTSSLSSDPGVWTSLGRTADVRALRSAASVLQLFRRGEPLALMPNVLVRE
jgi:protease-4